MPIKYLKKAIKTPSSDDNKTRATVQSILNDIEKRREESIKEITKKFDKYEGEIVVSKEKIEFSNFFLNRTEMVSEYYLTYFNNDIQYGSKYILKRFIDIFLSLFGLIILSPIFLLIYFYILILDGGGQIIKLETLFKAFLTILKKEEKKALKRLLKNLINTKVR